MSAVVTVLVAAGLGLLAFFEPCTLAVHALFMERSARAGRAAGGRAMLMLWSARLLVVTLPLVLLSLLPPLAMNGRTAGTALAAMALLYLVSRRHDLPVPHLAFHRLVPGGARLPEAVRLGLTLPACTLPLWLVVAGLVWMASSPLLALAAGAGFATLLSLPMLGITRGGPGLPARRWLATTARLAPWTTALLLLVAAGVLWWPQLEAWAGDLQPALEEAGASGLLVAAVAGLVFSFNPISFAAIPVVLAHVARSGEGRNAWRPGAAFVAGLLITHLVLGWAAAVGGAQVKDLLGRQWTLVLGPVLIGLGLMWAGVLRLRLPWFGVRVGRLQGAWGAFWLALPFSVAVCPFCAPALLVALTASAAIGSPLYGAALLLAFAVGRSLPILIGAWSLARLESLGVFSRYHRWIERIAGGVLVLTGLYLLNEYFFWIDRGTMG